MLKAENDWKHLENLILHLEYLKYQTASSRKSKHEMIALGLELINIVDRPNQVSQYKMYQHLWEFFWTNNLFISTLKNINSFSVWFY